MMEIPLYTLFIMFNALPLNNSNITDFVLYERNLGPVFLHKTDDKWIIKGMTGTYYGLEDRMESTQYLFTKNLIVKFIVYTDKRKTEKILYDDDKYSDMEERFFPKNIEWDSVENIKIGEEISIEMGVGISIEIIKDSSRNIIAVVWSFKNKETGEFESLNYTLGPTPFSNQGESKN